MSAPATVNACANTSEYLNADAIDAIINNDGETAYGSDDKGRYLSFRAESIYVGYKYYETRYEDAVVGAGNAIGKNGASNGAASWKYENEVVFPCGHGLSYTTFRQTLKNDVRYNGEKDVYELSVTVKNTGSRAGKSVVQVYAQTPFGDYEKANRVEKPAVTLVGFGKTDLIQPGSLKRSRSKRNATCLPATTIPAQKVTFSAAAITIWRSLKTRTRLIISLRKKA